MSTRKKKKQFHMSSNISDDHIRHGGPIVESVKKMYLIDSSFRAKYIDTKLK